MLKLVLNNTTAGELVVLDAPINIQDLSFTFSRSKIYHSVMYSFSGEIEFVGDGKNYIDNIVFDTTHVNYQGIDALITCKVYIANTSTMEWDIYIDGILNLETLKTVEYKTICDVIDGSFEQKIINRDENQVKIYGLKDIDNNTIANYSGGQVPINCDGIYAGDDIDAYLPFQIFRRIVHILSGTDDKVASTFFKNTYTSMEQYEIDPLLIIGLQIRYDTSEFTRTINFTTSLRSLFVNLDKIYCLSLYFQDNLVNINQRSEVFRKEMIVDSEGNNILISDPKDLTIEINREMCYNKVKTGYTNFLDTLEDNRQVEYNIEAEYSFPVKVVKNELDIVSDLRGDALGFEDVRNNYPIDVDEMKGSPYDDQLFIISAMFEGSSYKNKHTYKATCAGIANELTLYQNWDITPARNLIRHSKYFSSILADYLTNDLFIANRNTTSTASIKYDSEAEPIVENSDLPVYQLQVSDLSIFKARFSAPLTAEMVAGIKLNRHGLIGVWDKWAVPTPKYRYGWIQEVSTHSEDRTENFELILSKYGNEDLLGYWLAEDGTFCLAEDGSYIINEDL